MSARHVRLTALALAAAALTACASTGTGSTLASSEAERIENGAPRSPYGLYLSAQAAMQKGRSAEAAARFRQAAGAAPGDPLIRERAFTSALLAGEIKQAAALAPSGPPRAPGQSSLGRLVVAVDALAADQPKVALAAVADDPVGYPHRRAAQLLTPWIKAAAGDREGAVAPVVAGRDRFAEVFGGQGRALLLERNKRHDEAQAAFQALVDKQPDNDLILLAYGAFLERRGKPAEAAALYEVGLQDEADDAELAAALARARARRTPPPAPTLKQGAASAMLAAAAAFLAEDQDELAHAYLRLALHLDPKLDEAWTLVGDRLVAENNLDAARAAYARIRPSADEYAPAQAKLALTYQAEGNEAEALRLAEAAAKAAPTARPVQLAYADLLRSAERWPEAIAVFDRLLAAGPSDKPDWRLLYLRGISHDSNGDWPAAERDLQRALELQPEEPNILNYLGYGWIDRSQRLEEAFAMVEKAVALRPESGAIVDSLGWGHYRRGRFDQAVIYLERAVQLEPGNWEVNDHLGDAYWRVGRRIEAQFQWRRALSLEPTPKAKAALDAKLARGLDPAGQPAAAPVVARP